MARRSRQQREEMAFFSRHWQFFGAVGLAAVAVGVAAWKRPDWFEPSGKPWVHLLWLAGAGIVAMRTLIPSIAGWAQWKKRQNLAEQRWTAKNLLAMDWRDFETLTAVAFERQGWTVEQTGLGGPDGGVDVVLRRGRVKALGQCKRHSSAVGVKVAREILGEMHARGFHEAYVIAASGFTRDAEAFAETCKKSGNNLVLIDGAGLVKMLGNKPDELDLGRARQERARKASQGGAADEAAGATGARKPVARIGGQAPQCPQCGNPMRPARAKKGPSAGQWFWGCPSWPQCRGTRPDDGRILAWASKRQANTNNKRIFSR